MTSTFRAAARAASAACRSAAFRSIPSVGRSAARRAPCISRLPVELDCVAGMSLLPLHSAVAAARLTSRLSTASRSCCALSQGQGTAAGPVAATQVSSKKMKKIGMFTSSK